MWSNGQYHDETPCEHCGEMFAASAIDEHGAPGIGAAQEPARADVPQEPRADSSAGEGSRGRARGVEGWDSGRHALRHRGMEMRP